MNVSSILSDIKAKRFKPVYLLHGDEPYYIDLISDALENRVIDETHKGFDQSIYYGKDISITDLVNACRRYPMMAQYQVVIVKEAQDLKWKSEEDILLKYIENLTPTTILVLAYKYSKFDKRKKIYKSIAKVGGLLESNKLYDNKMSDWIDSYVREKGSRIHPHAATLVADFLGTNLSKVANELDKLLLNIGSQKEVSLKDIEENIGISKDFNVFEFTSALGKKDAYKAIQIVDYFSANPRANPIPPMVGMVGNYFTRLLKYHYLPNKSPQVAAKDLGVHPFFMKEYEVAAMNYNKWQVYNVLHQLKEYDLKFKGVNTGPLTTDADILKEMVFKILS